MDDTNSPIIRNDRTMFVVLLKLLRFIAMIIKPLIINPIPKLFFELIKVDILLNRFNLDKNIVSEILRINIDIPNILVSSSKFIDQNSNTIITIHKVFMQ